mgnify:CR=1 FL=1
MTEKQELLLQLFREVDAICKKHNLRYVMAGGTLIGVLRNEGFIPWDDDVDIYMPKSDWDKFVEICKTEIPQNRALYCSDVDRTYTNGFPRYGGTDSCAIHKHQIIGDDKAGEIIDVLTLDPIPDDDREYEKYRTHMMIYTDLLNISMVVGARWEIPAFQYLYWLFRYKFFGKDRTLKKLEKIMFSYKEEECSRYAMRWGGCPFLFDKNMMFPVKYMDFEGEKVMIPHRTSDYLIWHYGDEWSYIPPHGERESHESIYVPGASYQEIRDEYMPRIDKNRIRRQMTFRKFYCLLMAKGDHKLDKKRNRIRAGVIAKDLGARFLRSEKSLETLLLEKRYDVLNEIFDSYYRTQLSVEFIGREDYKGIQPFYHPTLVPVEDAVFQAAMLTLIYTERVGKAWRMYEVRRKLDHLTPEMEQTVEDIRLFRKAATHYEFREMKEAETIVDDLLKKYPDAPGFLKFKCRFVMERLEGPQNASEAEKFLSYCLRVFPQDGYFMKYKGVHMNIAICDIDKEFASIIKLKIEEKLGSVDVDIYTDSKLLMQSDKVYDCVFLYMDMPDINGIDMARCIREKYTFTKMIFILSKLDAVVEVMKYNPYRFIRKEHLEEDIKEVIAVLKEKSEEELQYINFKILGERKPLRFNIKDIVMFEVFRHELKIKLEDKEVRIKATLEILEKTLEAKGFIRVHKSYIVNYLWIEDIIRNEVILNNGQRVPLSRQKKQMVIQRLNSLRSNKN